MWPAVLGHSLFNTVLVYIYSNFTSTISETATTTFWVYTVMSWLVWIGLIAVTAQTVRRRGADAPVTVQQPATTRMTSNEE